VPGVADATVHLRSGRARATGRRLSRDALRRAVATVGYSAE
jgi:hypothetical protein